MYFSLRVSGKEVANPSYSFSQNRVFEYAPITDDYLAGDPLPTVRSLKNGRKRIVLRVWTERRLRYRIWATS